MKQSDKNGIKHIVLTVCQDNHWFFAILTQKLESTQQAGFFDPLGMEQSLPRKTFQNKLTCFFNSEPAAVDSHFRDHSFDPTMVLFEPAVPQTNSFDCGILVVKACKEVIEKLAKKGQEFTTIQTSNIDCLAARISIFDRIDIEAKEELRLDNAKVKAHQTCN